MIQLTMTWPNLTMANQTVKNGLKANFSLYKILKRFSELIQSYDDEPFLDPEWHIFPEQKIFLVQTIAITFIYLLALFIVQNLKSFSCGSRVMRMRNFWALNGPFPQMRIFFRKFVNDPCFPHSRLSTCQTSKPDINLLVKY